MKSISDSDASGICRVLRIFGTFKGRTTREADAIRRARLYAEKLAKISD